MRRIARPSQEPSHGAEDCLRPVAVPAFREMALRWWAAVVPVRDADRPPSPARSSMPLGLGESAKHHSTRFGPDYRSASAPARPARRPCSTRSTRSRRARAWRVGGLGGLRQGDRGRGRMSGHAEDPDMFPVLRATETTTSTRSSTALDLTTYAEAPAARAASRPSSPRSTKIEPLTRTTRHPG